MKSSSFLKAVLYVGVILLLLTIAIAFNSLRVVTINGTKTIRTAQDRFKLDDFESQIKDAIKANPKDHPFPLSKRQNIDEMLLKLEQLLAGQKLPILDHTKKKWELLKEQQSPDSTEIMQEFDVLHGAINKNFLDDITKQVVNAEKDITRLKVMKIVLGIQIFAMVMIALYIDGIANKEKSELKRRLEESEKKAIEAIKPKTTSISNETLKNIADSIGNEGMARIVQTFLLELPKAEESINQLLLKKDINELHKIAEHNKFSALSVGAEGLADLFNQLEQTEKLETAIDINSKINLEGAEVMSKLQEQITTTQL